MVGPEGSEIRFSTRLFIGDRVGRLDIVYEDDTEDLIPLLFGVNLWNYDLFEPGKPWEQGLMPFNGPYREPFESDPKAAKLFSNCLRLMENTHRNSGKSNEVGYGRENLAHKTVRQIFYIADETREAGVNISSVTALLAGNEPDRRGPCWT